MYWIEILLVEVVHSTLPILFLSILHYHLFVTDIALIFIIGIDIVLLVVICGEAAGLGRSIYERAGVVLVVRMFVIADTACSDRLIHGHGFSIWT